MCTWPLTFISQLLSVICPSSVGLPLFFVLLLLLLREKKIHNFLVLTIGMWLIFLPLSWGRRCQDDGILIFLGSHHHCFQPLKSDCLCHIPKFQLRSLLMVIELSTTHLLHTKLYLTFCCRTRTFLFESVWRSRLFLCCHQFNWRDQKNS